MRNRQLFAFLRRLASILALAAHGSELAAQPIERRPILIDTDIGTDIDDAFALGLAIGSHELDLRGVTTVGDPSRERGLLLCRFLTMTGRRGTSVALGSSPQISRPIIEQRLYHYHPDPLFDRTTKPVAPPAVDFLSDKIGEAPGELRIAALGPLTNVARLIESHPDVAVAIREIVTLESNLALDIPAARRVLESRVKIAIVSTSVTRDLRLDDEGVQAVFSPGTPLTRQVQTLYQMWDRERPPLGDALVVALLIDPRLAKREKRALVIRDDGALEERDKAPNVELITTLDPPDFEEWYARRMSSLVAPSKRPSALIDRGMFPNRVHVAEDFDDDIERTWWMSGKPESTLLPPGSLRACRGVLTHDFDDLLMVSRDMHAAVIFNPVPGPPMGKRPRLTFRYWLSGTPSLRVQIYSLSNGYHRQLVLRDLPQETWQRATVDMTEARRPDGTGGALGENERIDDIQFYVDPGAEVVIDDIVLFDAARADESRPFPARVIFTGWFDTGRQGGEWPGTFDIVSDAGAFWRAARSVTDEVSGKPWIRLGLRGDRRLGDRTHVSFRYRTSRGAKLEVRLHDSTSGRGSSAEIENAATGLWTETTAEFETSELESVDEIRFSLADGAELLIDDVLLYEPGS
jgi:inosine-uridine nucleoside N-ribohydrolase